MAISKIGIVGAGSWGTAIAALVASNNHEVKLWSRDEIVVSSINQRHLNQQYFPNINLSSNISATSEIADLNASEYIFMAIPTQTLRAFLSVQKLPSSIPLILCSKGIEENTLKFPAEIIAQVAQNETMILSGPNFAHEIMQNLPASSVIAADSMEKSNKIISLLDQDNFRVYASTDKIGVQVCGAVKNIIAIATGISVGKSWGENAKAAIIAKGINEIAGLIKALGGKSETLLSLAGIGDLVLTCSSTLSRNMSYGISLAQNKASSEKTVEGYHNAKAIYELGTKLSLKLPLCYEVYAILYQGKDIDEAFKGL